MNQQTFGILLANVLWLCLDCGGKSHSGERAGEHAGGAAATTAASAAAGHATTASNAISQGGSSQGGTSATTKPDRGGGDNRGGSSNGAGGVTPVGGSSSSLSSASAVAGAALGCVEVARTPVEAPGGSEAGASTGGTQGMSGALSQLAPFPAGADVVLRSASTYKWSPAIGASGDVLGLAYVDAPPSMTSRRRLRFGINADPDRNASAWSFIDVAEIAEHKDASGIVLAADGGFDVLWTVCTDPNSTGADDDRMSLLHARIGVAGALVSAPVLLAQAPGSLACGAARGGDTLAIACAEKQSWETTSSVWLQLCRDAGACSRCQIVDSPSHALRPSVAWDGAAFDVLLNNMGEAKDEVQLTRVDANGQVLLAPTPLEVGDDSSGTASAIAWDGGNLVVAHGGRPKLSLFDLSGARTKGPFDWVDPQAYQFPLEYDYQLQVNSSGYAVWGFGTTGIDTSYGHPYAAQLMVLARSAPDQILSVPGIDWYVDGSVASLGDEFIAVWADGGNLSLGRLVPSTGKLKAAPQYIFPTPSVPLNPLGVHCDADSCYVLAREPVPNFGTPADRTGVWMIDRATGTVTSPAQKDTTRGYPRETDGVAVGSRRFVAVIQEDGYEGPISVVAWNDAQKVSSDVWTYTPSADGSTSDTPPRPFMEGLATRILFVESTTEGQSRYLQLLVNGSWEEPAPLESGNWIQCGNAYLLIQQDKAGDPCVVKRWHPGALTEDDVVLKIQSQGHVNALCCSDSLFALLLDQAEVAVYTLEGQLISTRSEENRSCMASGSSLLFWPIAESAVHGYRLLPDGTIDAIDSWPNNLSNGWNSGALQMGPDLMARAWIDDAASTHLSLWQAP